MEAPGKFNAKITITTVIPISTGISILHTVPIPLLIDVWLIRKINTQTIIIEINTVGVNELIPLIELVECRRV